MTHVHLTDDYYTGPGFYDMTGVTEYDWMDIYEIPQEQLGRWEKADEAYLRMQDEIAEIMRTGKRIGKKAPHFPGLPH